MTDKARELLERVLTGIDRYGDIYPETLEEIRAYLAEPEVKREALSEDDINGAYRRDKSMDSYMEKRAFGLGVRFAERHYGIGGGE